MSHALSFAVISALFYFFLKYYRQNELTLLNFLILGFIVGLAALIRWQNGLYIILPLFLIWQEKNGWQQKLKQLTILTITSLIVFLPQLLMWKYLFGSYFVAPQGTKFFDLLSPHLGQFLFSGDHGLFIWHPLLFLSLLGLAAFFLKDKKLTLVLSACLTLQIYMNSAANSISAAALTASLYSLIFK
ncbi:MAG: hypothetical protein NT116_04315 [Candidatus Parcubacteria bacterium]|nr:hypothetical protein [Candidatus Parcubacteria bacterium]